MDYQFLDSVNPSPSSFSRFYLMVAIATTRYCSGVEGISEQIPVVVFVSCPVDSLMFTRSSMIFQYVAVN